MAPGPKPHLSYNPGGTWGVRAPGYFGAVYDTQYYVNVFSEYGNHTLPSGWYKAGLDITSEVTSPWTAANGTHYVCTGWNGSGSVPPSGSGTAVTFNLTAPSSITWNWAKAKILGDIDGDGVVDIFDIVAITSAYGSREGDSNWNAVADLTQPFGQIDIYDMVTCLSHYGSS